MIDTEQKIFMILLGCKPKDRYTEQHDIFFGIGPSLKSLVPQMKSFWASGQHNLHIDAWREVGFVDGHKISIDKQLAPLAPNPNDLILFFINLGGYEKGIFDELHYKLLIVAPNTEEAIKKAKNAVFFKTVGFEGATSHIDDKYDVDDIININDIFLNDKFYIRIEKLENSQTNEDEIHLGYFKLNALKD